MTTMRTCLKSKKKWTVALALVLLLTGLFSGCSSEVKDIDLNQLSEDLLSQISFDGTLVKLDDSVINNYFNFEDMNIFEEFLFYKDDFRDTAEEIALIKVKEDSQVSSVRSVVESHVSDLKEQVENYDPSDSFRIDNAVIKTSGNYVMLVITTEYEKAEEIINSYL